MKLTIIIVNYNVKYFLEQTLQSVFRSKVKFDFEVIVVDNASVDGSMAMVRDKFPQVSAIDNVDNVGFSKANNQGIDLAQGEYVLLLNPDTILSEETLQVVVDRMDDQAQIGGLGVRMIDGGGHFLPESKRGLPTPFVAFCKAFGLSRLFPKSERFNYYHLGHISEFESAEVDVLSGAFMLMRKEVTDKIGGLDETFFMYGEDIDMSYRIQKAGYVNWYEATTSIVHFKGESTKRGSLNYVRVFYKAMIIFANKHFVGGGAFLMSLLYQLAVILRAGISLLVSFLKWLVPVALDGIVIFCGLRILALLWAQYYFNDPDYYQSVPLSLHHLVYAGVWLSVMYVGGVYDRYFKIRNLYRSLILGTFILLVAFSLMSSEWRPSRAIVILGAVWSVISLTLLRWLIAKLKGVKSDLSKRIAVVGSDSEILRTQELLRLSGIEVEEWILVAPGPDQSSKYKGEVNDLADIVEAYQADEVIFCAKDIENAEIMKWMSVFSGKISVKIIQEEGAGIIGSRYKHRRGEWYAIDAQMAIAQPERKRQKRILDVLICLALLVGVPLFIFVKSARAMYHSFFDVILGRKTWISYHQSERNVLNLPQIKSGVFNIGWGIDNSEVRERVAYLYAKDYSPWMDVEALGRIFFSK